MFRVIFSSSLCSTGVNPSSAVLSVIPYKKVSVGRRFGVGRSTEFFFTSSIFLKMGIRYLSHDFRCAAYYVSFRFGYIEQKLGNFG